MRKLLILWAIFAFCLSTVSALQISNPALGSSSAERDMNITSTFTITNDGTVTLTNFQITSTADAKYKIAFENIPQSVASGSSAVVTLKGYIPKDFEAGKRSIGTITVTASNASGTGPFGTHTFTPQNQTPQQVSLPVGMSATSDCGTNTQSPSTPVIGQWHAGKCDSSTDIQIMQPFAGSSDAGWARLHSDKISDYWINAVGFDCNGGQTQVPPNAWLYGGKIHTGPGICDNNVELAGGDSGWVGLYTRPEADGQLIFVIAENTCGGSAQSIPANGVILGKVRTGPGNCDGSPEAYSYTGVALDSGYMYVVYLPIDHTPVNNLPVGSFESLSWTGLSGWAYDKDAPTINVNVFVDGTFWKSLTANVSRQDLVNAGFIPDSYHGFSYQFTQTDIANLDQTKNHTFHVYAINSPQGDNPLLNNSPKVLAAILNATSTNTTNTTNTSTTNSTTTTTSTGNPNASNTASATLTMEAKNHLIFDKVKITCTKLETVNQGTTIDDVSPGEKCYLTVKVKNTFVNDIDIKNIKIKADPEKSDIDDDSADISRLDAGDDEEKTLELAVEESAKDGKVNVDVTAEGTDENGAKHSAKLTFAIDIERLKHDLPISKITVNPKQADCNTARIDVAVYVENKGKTDEDKVAVELSVPGLNFLKKISDISIDQDDEEKVTFSIPITSAAPFGSFRATAKSFFENAGQNGTSTADIVIVKCAVEPPAAESRPKTITTTTKTSEPVVVPPPFVPQDEIIIIPPAGQETKAANSFGASALLTGILVILNLIALSVLGVMGYGYFKKKPDSEEQPIETVEVNEYY